MGLSIFDESDPFIATVQIQPADTTGVKSLVVAQKRRLRIDAIVAVNKDTIAHYVYLYPTVAGNPCRLGSAAVPSGAGSAGAVSIDVLAGSLPATVVGLVLPIGDTLDVFTDVTVLALGYVQVTAIGGYI